MCACSAASGAVATSSVRCYPDPFSDGQFRYAVHVHFFHTQPFEQCARRKGFSLQQVGAGASVCRSTHERVWRIIGGINGDSQRGVFVVMLDAIVITVKPEDGPHLQWRGRGGGCRCMSVHAVLAPQSLHTAAYPTQSLIILGCVV